MHPYKSAAAAADGKSMPHHPRAKPEQFRIRPWVHEALAGMQAGMRKPTGNGSRQACMQACETLR